LLKEILELAHRANFWDQAADGSNEHFKQPVQFYDPVEVARLQTYLDQTASILDFGCGYGRVTNILHQAGFKNLLAVDISLKMLLRLKTTFPHLAENAMCYDGKMLPFENAQLDGIIAFTVLSSIPNQQELEALFLEFNRVLKPMGVFYLCEFLITENERDIQRYQQFQLGKHEAAYGTFLHSSGQVFRHYSTEALETLMSGFNCQWKQQKHFKSMNGNPCRLGDWIALKSK